MRLEAKMDETFTERYTWKVLASFTDYVVQDFVLDNLYTSNIEFKSRYLWNSTNQSFLHV